MLGEVWGAGKSRPNPEQGTVLVKPSLNTAVMSVCLHTPHPPRTHLTSVVTFLNDFTFLASPQFFRVVIITPI